MASELIVQTLKGPTSGANANKILLGSGQELYAPGHVIQIVNEKYNTLVASTSTNTTFDSGLSASITPTSTSSKILVLVSSNGIQLSGNSYGQVVLADGNNTLLTLICSPIGYTNSSDESVNCVSTSFLHSPNSVSEQTYKVRGNLRGGTYMCFQTASSGSSESTITLMEIAG
jgi:hypothetical protein